MTFEPHPVTVLRPGSARPALTTLGQRLGLLENQGADVVVVAEPTREFLAMSAPAFLEEVVAGAVGARVMVEGPSFTFGNGATGNVEMVRREGERVGLELKVVATQQVALSDLTLVNVSSSLIRWLVGQGRVADAGKCLGRSYGLVGEVVKGAQRGRTIGFPTANVKSLQLLPGPGVYGGRCRLGDGREFRAAISVGTNPTFAGAATTVEAYLLDFEGELYGQEVEVLFDRWLRDMWAFGGVDGLVRQIKRDVEEVRTQKTDARRR